LQSDCEGGIVSKEIFSKKTVENKTGEENCVDYKEFQAEESAGFHREFKEFSVIFIVFFK